MADGGAAEILAEWRERHDTGEVVDPEEVIRRHPDLADELRDGFDALYLVGLAFGVEAEEHELPERIGDYRVLDHLGDGGMGTVYLASAVRAVAGLAAGEKVALKVVHPHLLERRGFFKRFLREADLGRQVRHRNVVRTIDVDAVRAGRETVHFLVMEYVAGRTLRGLLHDLGTVPEPLLREIALQVAEALAAVHAAGIVHRDLKPENVLITDLDQVRVMDLGVARDVSATATLTHEGQFVGSLAYAAPEQFGADDVGPAADLYSLGVLLYELAVGVNPFQRDDAAGVIAAHTREPAPSAADASEDVSPFLSEVVATLLRKDPGERIESADALVSLLRDAERSAWWAERERALLERRSRVPFVPVRRDTKIYGRDDDLALLRSAWERARAGDGNTLLLEGEAGIGKSRLVDAFLHSMGGDDAHVLYGSYPPAGGMGGLSDAILENLGLARLEEGLAPLLGTTPSLVPAFAALVRREAPPEGAAPVEGDALHALFCHLVRALAAQRPLVWVVDDLHFASAESRAIVLSMARVVSGHRVLLLATARPGLPEQELAHFARLETCLRKRLGRLSPRQVIELLRDAFRSEVLADKLGARIAYKSDGIPFFVFEMIRGLEEGQFISRLPDGTCVETREIERIEVPSAVRDLIDGRLRDLDKDERAILDVGAVQGYEFDPDLVARVLERKRVAVLQDLAGIERRSGIVRGGRGVCRFDHHQIQEVLYEDLPPDLRVEYHALSAGALETRESVGELSPERIPGLVAVDLARHFLKGDRGHRASRYVNPALEHLGRTYQNEALVEFVDEALATADVCAGASRVDLLLSKAKHLAFLGRQHAERAAVEEALGLADRSGDVRSAAAARVSLGGCLLGAGRYDEAGPVLERALALAREAGDERLEAAAEGNLGTLHKWRSDYDRARAHYEARLEVARRVGDRRAEGGALMQLANNARNQGRSDDAWALIREHQAVSAALSDTRLQALGAQVLGSLLLDRCRYVEAHAAYERSLTLFREVGDRAGELVAMGNCGIVPYFRGDLEETRARYEGSLALAIEVGDPRHEARATDQVAGIAAAQGRLAEAMGLRRRSLAMSRELGNRRLQAYTLYFLAQDLQTLGDFAMAEDNAIEAARICSELGLREVAAHAVALRGRLAEQRGELEQAEALTREAHSAFAALEHQNGLAETLDDLGHLLARLGRPQEARDCLERAMRHALDVDIPSYVTLVAARLALLPGGDAAAACDVLEEKRDRLEPVALIEVGFLLWQATRDPAHLAQAHGLLQHLRNHAPEEYRDSMIENVPLHRDIMAAWRERGSSESETVVGA